MLRWEGCEPLSIASLVDLLHNIEGCQRSGMFLASSRTPNRQGCSLRRGTVLFGTNQNLPFEVTAYLSGYDSRIVTPYGKSQYETLISRAFDAISTQHNRRRDRKFRRRL